MKKIFLSVLFLELLFSYELSFDQFVASVEKNSIELIKSKAQFDAGLQEQKANMAWNPSSLESEVSLGKNGNTLSVESTTLFMLAPRLPWVVSMLKQSLQVKTLQYQKNYELLKELSVIGAKRVYLSYLFTKEKYAIYQQREQNFLSQLKIAELKFKLGSVSKKDYVNFKNSYYDVKASRVQTQKELMELESALAKILGIKLLDKEIKVLGLDFVYFSLKEEEIKDLISKSPYIEILALSAKDYGINAKASSYERWDSFQIGAGLQNTTMGNLSENQANIRLQLPIPLTKRYDHLKKKFMVLQSATLRESEVTKNNIEVQALSYFLQLKTKREFIDVQKESINNKKELVEMGKFAYESQKISLFEYLAYQNAYMDALIKMIEAKMEYVQIQTFLEETLGIALKERKIK
ncbi:MULTISPECIES: TolC family protein [unclassified Helicobacter]|uniref:TolC family protein n=1 Tax=unclassified Helicobacter TaxID=2593540 RepID=UPI000CF0375A|nr:MULTISPECIES: TolC family protein [unclassified Helicobacter]